MPNLRRYQCVQRAALMAGAVLLSAGTAASADEVFTARTAITLPGTQNVTAFDISFVDPVIGLYLLADRTNAVVDVIDTTTNTVLTQLAATPPFAGVVIQNGKANNDVSGPDAHRSEPAERTTRIFRSRALASGHWGHAHSCGGADDITV